MWGSSQRRRRQHITPANDILKLITTTSAKRDTPPLPAQGYFASIRSSYAEHTAAEAATSIVQMMRSAASLAAEDSERAARASRPTSPACSSSSSSSDESFTPRKHIPLRRMQSFLSGQGEIGLKSSVPRRRVATTRYYPGRPPFVCETEVAVGLVSAALSIPDEHLPGTFADHYAHFADDELVSSLFWYVFVIAFQYADAASEADAKLSLEAKYLVKVICTKFVDLTQDSYFGAFRNVFLMYVGYVLAETVYVLFKGSFPLEPRASAVFGPAFRNAVYRHVCSLLNGFEVSQSLIESMQNTLFKASILDAIAKSSSSHPHLKGSVLKVFNTKSMVALESSKMATAGKRRRVPRRSLSSSTSPATTPTSTFLTQLASDPKTGRRRRVAHRPSTSEVAAQETKAKVDAILLKTRNTYDLACQLAILPDIKRNEEEARAAARALQVEANLNKARQLAAAESRASLLSFTERLAPHGDDDDDDESVLDVTDASLSSSRPRRLPFHVRVGAEVDTHIQIEPLKAEKFDVYKVSPAMERYLDGNSPFKKKTRQVTRSVPDKVKVLMKAETDRWDGGDVGRARHPFKAISRRMTGREAEEKMEAARALEMKDERLRSIQTWLRGEEAKATARTSKVLNERDPRRRQARLDAANAEAAEIRDSLLRDSLHLHSSASRPYIPSRSSKSGSPAGRSRGGGGRGGAITIADELVAYLDRIESGDAARKDVIITQKVIRDSHGRITLLPVSNGNTTTTTTTAGNTAATPATTTATTASESGNGGGVSSEVHIKVRRGTSTKTQNLLFDLELYDDSRITRGYSLSADQVVDKVTRTTRLFESVIAEERSRVTPTTVDHDDDLVQGGGEA